MPTWDELPQLKLAARILWPRLGPWAYETWERLNSIFFGGELEPCGILWGLTPHGHSLGHFDPRSRIITLHPSNVEPKGASPWGMGDVLGTRHTADVLLHEMLHQVLTQRHGYRFREAGTSSHNNPHWVAEVKRISLLLGYNVKAEVVRQRRVRGQVRWAALPGHLSLVDLATWPHSIRPPAFYRQKRRATSPIPTLVARR